MSGQGNTIPEFEIDVSKLPSRGVPYPADLTVLYRTYMFGEVRQASTSSLNPTETLKRTMRGLIVNSASTPQFTAQDLTVNDAMYLGILRKVSTFQGMDIEVPFVCLKCRKSTKGVFKETDLKFKDLSPEVTELPAVIEIKDALTGKMEELQLSPMTVRDFIDMETGRYDKTLNGVKIGDVEIYAKWVRNMPYDKAYKLLSMMSDKDDMLVFQDIDKLFKHDMERITVKCGEPKCGHENRVRLEGRESLLNPFRGGKTFVGNRIRFGNASKHQSPGSGQDGVESSTTTST